MKRVLPIALCIVAISLVASAVFAAAPPSNANVRFALHAITKPTGKTAPPICPNNDGSPVLGALDPNSTGTPCDEFVTSFPANSATWIYLVLGHGDPAGLNGCSFGVEYQNIWEAGYLNSLLGGVLCDDGLEFPSQSPQVPWPQSGGGMLLTWATCQTTNVGGMGSQAVVWQCYVYGYSGGHYQVTPNLTKVSGPELDINTCGAGTTKLLAITAPDLQYQLTGQVDFGGPGRNPCIIVPTHEQKTWGRIKTLFTDGE